MAAAPERRKGPDGTREIRVRDEWLPEEDPASMGAWRDWQDGQAAPSLLGHVTSSNGAKPAKQPTARQREVWEAVEEHGTQGAAAKALGITQSAVQSGLKGYMKAMGIDGPMPGYQTKARGSSLDAHSGSSKASRPAPKRKPRGAAAPKREAKGQVTQPAHASGSVSETQEGTDDIGAPVTSEPVEDERSDHSETIPLSEQATDDDPDVSAIVDAHRDGYARGYAVAVLRVVANWELAELPEFLQTMASDAADGLMS